MAQDDVVTGIDGLLKYVTEKGEADASTISGALGVSEATVHDWSTVLEKAKLVKMVYKLGKMYVGPITESIKVEQSESESTGSSGSDTDRYEKLAVAEIEHINEVKSEILSDNVLSQSSALEKVGPIIKDLKMYISAVEKGYKSKEVDIKKYVNELQALRAEASKSLETIGNYKTSIDTLVNQMGTGGTALKGEQTMVLNLDEVSKNTKALIDDIRSKSTSLTGMSDQMLREFDSKVAEHRTKLVAMSAAVKQESKRLDMFAKEAEVQLSDYQKRSTVYKHEFENINARSEKDRQAFIDKSSRAKQEISNLYNAAEKKFNSLDILLSNEALSMAKLTDIDLRIRQAETSLSQIAADKDSLQKQVNQMVETLRKITKDKNISAAEKNNTMVDIEKTAKTTSAKSKALKENVSKLRDDITDITKQK